MSKVTNIKQIPLPLAVWLARDTYDYGADRSRYMSATELLKPVKSLVLSRRIDDSLKTSDLHDYVPSRIGTAIHDSIEKAWNSEELPKVLESLGIKQKVIVNPTDEIPDGHLAVYMEQRSHKQIQDFLIGGKYDFIFDGTLTDFKSTSTFTYVNKTNNEKYRIQGSIYRWLNPDKITSDVMTINYIFTDWKAGLAQSQKDYPPARAMEVQIPLMSLEETEQFIESVINKFKIYETADEINIPACNDEELWRRPSVWKYYKDLAKTARSTKNFDNPNDAHSHAMTLMGKNPSGGVIEVKGEVVACKYCDAFAICQQKDQYIVSGELGSF